MRVSCHTPFSIKHCSLLPHPDVRARARVCKRLSVPQASSKPDQCSPTDCSSIDGCQRTLTYTGNESSVQPQPVMHRWPQIQWAHTQQQGLTCLRLACSPTTSSLLRRYISSAYDTQPQPTASSGSMALRCPYSPPPPCMGSKIAAQPLKTKTNADTQHCPLLLQARRR